MPEERKLVSILFADVTGSTALGDSMDAEDVRALMSRYYDHARRIIPAYGGTLEKFIGDAVMAIFGLDQSHGDDAERALAAALALREAIATDEILNRVFRLRIGVNTGEVVASGDSSSGDFLVTGDAVNVSARLQQGANPGEIIASDRTANAAQNAFLFEEERLLQAKGKPQPLRVFPLKGPRARRQVERPPFVGRRQDLLQLDVLKERTLEEQRPQLVSIVAPAGTGKSRLLEEFLQRLDPADGFQVAFSRCLPYGQTLTFWPLRGLLSELLGSEPEKERVQEVFLQGGYAAEDATRLSDLILTTLGIEEKSGSKEVGQASTPTSTLPSTQSNPGEQMKPGGLNILNDFHLPASAENWMKFADNLDNLKNFNPMTSTEDWTKLVGGLNALNSLKNSPVPPYLTDMHALTQKLREQGEALGNAIRENVSQAIRESLPARFRATDHESIFAAWRLLIEVLSTQAPRIIVFEDLHWASESLLDLVEYIIHLRTSASLLLIALSRPELLDRRPAWNGGRQNFTFLSLQPLGDRQIRDLINRLDPAFPEGIREQIVTRSGGNPFFALELLHAFAELSLKGEAASIASLPDTVHAAVLARIDLLSRPERGILQAASVASRAFRTPLLEAIMDQYTVAEIATALDGLLARDMIIQIEHDRYNFRHILVRDVAYGSLSRGERIRLHSKVAIWLEANAGDHLDEYIELIAYHYREAVQLSRQSMVPLALPFKVEEAALVFAYAGRLAGRIGSHAEAKNHLQLAIELSPENERMPLYEQLGDSILRGDVQSRAYQDALASWRATGEQEPLTGARLIHKVLIASTRNALVPTMEQEEVETLRKEALALAEAAGDEDERWRIRVTACFDPQIWSADTRRNQQDTIRATREVAWEAAAYFEQRQNWEALSEALDGYAQISFYIAPQDVLAALERRLTIPDLPAGEWADTVTAKATYYSIFGDMENCIAYSKDVFAHLRPGQSIAGLGPLAAHIANESFICGRWDEIDNILPRLDEIREQVVQFDQKATGYFIEGYLAALRVALAREDRPQIDALAAIVRTYGYGGMLEADFLKYLDALLADNARLIPHHFRGNEVLLTGLLLLFNEHGQRVPDGPESLKKVQEVVGQLPYYKHLIEIACALEEDDNAHLAQAIDDAEADLSIVHAARMRIVLAQRTGDLSQLERAYPVLKRLEDRMHLRKLEEVRQEILKRKV